MAGRKFSFVTFILLLLLAAAAANLYFVDHAYRRTVSAVQNAASPGGPLTTVTFSSEPPRSALPGMTVASFTPNWHGEATLIKSPSGGYDLIVEAIGRGTTARVPATAAEVEIQRPGDPAQKMTPKMQLATVGEFVAHIDLPSPGAWEVRVRIHRDLQTLEFAEKFELK